MVFIDYREFYITHRDEYKYQEPFVHVNVQKARLQLIRFCPKHKVKLRMYAVVDVV